MPDEAAQVLFELKDVKGLWNIHGIASRSNNGVLVTKIEDWIGILTARK